MYCPNCAASIDNVKYCRSCGANVSLVPQALTGKISGPEGQTLKDGRRHRSPATLENAIKSFFIGIAFLIIAGAVLRFAPAGGIWWFWMLLPAFAMIGEGIAKYLRWRSETEQEAAAASALTAQEPAQQLSAPATSSLEEPPQPSSVVEHTTYHLK